jgi:hypothetical protein
MNILQKFQIYKDREFTVESSGLARQTETATTIISKQIISIQQKQYIEVDVEAASKVLMKLKTLCKKSEIENL